MTITRMGDELVDMGHNVLVGARSLASSKGASSRNSPTRPPRQRGPPRLVATPAISSVPDAQQGLAEQRRTLDGGLQSGGVNGRSGVVR